MSRIGEHTGEPVGHFDQGNGTVLNRYETKDFNTGKWVIRIETLYRRSDGCLATSRLPYEYWYPSI